VFDYCPLTIIALDEAAPVELAAAALDDFATYDVIASTAAHEVTTVWRSRSPVTSPAARAQRSGSRIRLAEVRGLIEVDEIRVGGCLELFIDRHQLSSCAAN